MEGLLGLHIRHCALTKDLAIDGREIVNLVNLVKLVKLAKLVKLEKLGSNSASHDRHRKTLSEIGFG